MYTSVHLLLICQFKSCIIALRNIKCTHVNLCKCPHLHKDEEEVTWKNMKLDMKSDIHVNLVERDLWKEHIGCFCPYPRKGGIRAQPNNLWVKYKKKRKSSFYPGYFLNVSLFPLVFQFSLFMVIAIVLAASALLYPASFISV